MAKKVSTKKAATKTKTAVRKSATKGRATASRATDRARVSKQGPELAHVARKFSVSKDVVSSTIAKVGNMRVDVYAALTKRANRSKAADRAKVSRQPHEVALLAKKFKTSSKTVLATLATRGSSRKKVEAALAGK